MLLPAPRHFPVLSTAVLVFFGGIVAGIWRYWQTQQDIAAEFIGTANQCALAFEPAELKQLSGTAADLASPTYQRLKSRLLRLCSVHADTRVIYLLRLNPETHRAVILVDSEPNAAPEMARPGDDYPAAPNSPGLRTLAATSRSVLDGPVSADDASWFFSYALVAASPSGTAQDVLGCTLSADRAQRRLWFNTCSTAFCFWLLIGMPLAAYQANRRQRQQRDALRNLTEGMEQSHSSVMIFDLDGLIEYANAGSCRQIGYSRRDLIGRPWRDYQDPATARTLVDEQFDTIRSGQAWSGEWTMQRKDGSLLPVRGGVTPVKDRSGTIHSYVAVFEDMTEVRATEKILRDAKERAEAGDRTKSQFLATMSHEVRTPLNGIVGFSSLLLDTQLTPEQQEYVDTIRTSSETLIQLTGDILEYARIESGRLKLDPQPCDPRECVESALDLVASAAVAKNIELLHWVDASVPAAIIADVSRLRQVIVNLVNNATKFTAEGEVEVRLRTLSLDPSVTGPSPQCLLEFSVRDTGIGIAAEHHHRIFRPFSQVDDSTTRRYGGTGLGLAICKNIVELMGGGISFTSAAGHGATFTFTLPAPVQTPEPQLPACPLNGRKLAVSAAHPGLRRELIQLGHRFGADTVDLAESALATTPGWDLAILDVCGPTAMAIASGRSPLATLPAEKLIALVPVVLPGELRAVLRQHFRLVLNKPLHHDMLQSLLATPPAPPNPAAAAARPGLTAETYQLRVLIAEDNTVNQRLIQKVVSNLGCEIRLAANGRLALEEIQRSVPDVVLMDLHMPEMDGLTATIKIRAGEAGAAARDVWIIALTADAREEQRERSLAAGVNDYLTKPVRLPELTAAFRRLLASRQP